MEPSSADAIAELLRVTKGAADILDMMGDYYEQNYGTGDAFCLLVASLRHAASEAEDRLMKQE